MAVFGTVLSGIFGGQAFAYAVYLCAEPVQLGPDWYAHVRGAGPAWRHAGRRHVLPRAVTDLLLRGGMSGVPPGAGAGAELDISPGA